MQPLTQSTALVPLYLGIETTLTRHNVTTSVISHLKSECQRLTINGITDRKGYRAVRSARSKVKTLRVMTKKICQQGRRGALAEQRAWIAKEREITSLLLEIEKPLTAKQKAIDKQIEQIRLEQERIEAARIQKRIDRLAAYGSTIDLQLLKTLSDADFSQMVEHAKQMWTHAQEAIQRQKDAAKAETQRLRDLAKSQSETIKLMKQEVARIVAMPEKKEEKMVVVVFDPLTDTKNGMEDGVYKKVEQFAEWLMKEEYTLDSGVYSRGYYDNEGRYIAVNDLVERFDIAYAAIEKATE